MINPKIDNLYLTVANKIMRVIYMGRDGTTGHHIDMVCDRDKEQKFYHYDNRGEVFAVMGDHSNIQLKIVSRVTEETHPEYFL